MTWESWEILLLTLMFTGIITYATQTTPLKIGWSWELIGRIIIIALASFALSLKLEDSAKRKRGEA